MSPTALSALFPTATTTEGLTATEVSRHRLSKWRVYRRLRPPELPTPPILRLRVQRPRRKE